MPLESIAPNGLAPYPKDMDGEDDKELLPLGALSDLGNAKVNYFYVWTSWNKFLYKKNSFNNIDRNYFGLL